MCFFILVFVSDFSLLIKYLYVVFLQGLRHHRVLHVSHRHGQTIEAEGEQGQAEEGAVQVPAHLPEHQVRYDHTAE